MIDRSNKKSEKKQIPAVEGLFTWPSDEPRLIGGRCESCGMYFFPKFFPFHKPGCQQGQVKEVLLGKRGKLQSYTVQYYPPPPPFASPTPFIPYGIGLVALPEGISVIGMLTGIEVKDLKTNIDVELVVEKIYEDKEGNEILTWKFRSVKAY